MVIKIGAYLIYKLENPKEVIKVEKWLNQQQEQKELMKFQKGLWFWTYEDRKIELEKLKTKGYGCPDFKKIGEGEWKASGLSIDEVKCYNLVVKLFEKLHKYFKIKIYSGSCALSTDYFTKEQIKIITNNGLALSGKYKEKILKIIK